jgi:predicted TIM-barrel fold metal-dependent hydrolase
MIIDDNMHWMPANLFTDQSVLEAWLSVVPRAHGEYAYVRNLPGSDGLQIAIEQPRGCENLNFGPNVCDPELKLKAMDSVGVDKAILRVPCWQEWLTLELCRQVNHQLHDYIAATSNRFLGVAVVPPWGDRGSLHEAERCISELGFVGVEMAAHYGDLYLDEPEFRLYFKALDRLGVPIVVHHTPLPVDYQSLTEYPNLRRLYGRCVAQMTAVGRELFSDLFEECPNLRMVHSMLGGAFFAFADIIAPRRSPVKEEFERFDEAASERLRGYVEKNLYFDISHAPVWGKAQLECAVKVCGADHLLFGSSYPLRNEWLLRGIEFIRNLDIQEREKELILGGNAARLFNIH